MPSNCNVPTHQNISLRPLATMRRKDFREMAVSDNVQRSHDPASISIQIVPVLEKPPGMKPVNTRVRRGAPKV